jgi:polysaccharide export outer membrane protein
MGFESQNRLAGTGQSAKSSRLISATALAVLAFGLLALGCARPAAEPPPDEKMGLRVPYVIGIPDVLRITVWKNPELSVEVPVRSDGKISVPLLDDVQAEGLTPAELKEVISGKLARYISSPSVTVIVLQANSQVVTVVGGVLRAGTLPLNRQMRVLEVIAAVGGFNTWANRSDIRILRPTANGLVSYRFNYSAYVAGKEPDSNILVEPGDTIVIPE